MKYRVILFSIIFFSASIAAQPVQYKKYTNQVDKFTFYIPDYWTIKYSKAEAGVICVPATRAQRKIYKDCFEGIIFRMDFYKSSLDSTLNNVGTYSKVGDKYYTTDRVNDNVETKNLRGKNWIGIYHNNVCSISCKGTGFHSTAGQCEFIYFSKGKATVCINTNGMAFNKAILKKLINSFHFY